MDMDAEHPSGGLAAAHWPLGPITYTTDTYWGVFSVSKFFGHERGPSEFFLEALCLCRVSFPDIAGHSPDNFS